MELKMEQGVMETRYRAQEERIGLLQAELLQVTHNNNNNNNNNENRSEEKTKPITF